MQSHSHKSQWANFHQFPCQQDPAPPLRHSVPVSSQHLTFLDISRKKKFLCLHKKVAIFIFTYIYTYTHIFLHSVPSVFTAIYTYRVLKDRAKSLPLAHPHWLRYSAASWHILGWKFLIPGIMLHYGRNSCTSACFTSGLRDRTKRTNAFQRLDDVSSIRRTHSIIAISVW